MNGWSTYESALPDDYYAGADCTDGDCDMGVCDDDCECGCGHNAPPAPEPDRREEA